MKQREETLFEGGVSFSHAGTGISKCTPLNGRFIPPRGTYAAAICFLVRKGFDFQKEEFQFLFIE